jgi:hypothetical protein
MISTTEAEANPELVAIFVGADTNGDGVLTVVEFVAIPSPGDYGTATGATRATNASSGMGSGGTYEVQTPAQPNETQPGLLQPATGRR